MSLLLAPGINSGIPPERPRTQWFLDSSSITMRMSEPQAGLPALCDDPGWARGEGGSLHSSHLHCREGNLGLTKQVPNAGFYAGASRCLKACLWCSSSASRILFWDSSWAATSCETASEARIRRTIKQSWYSLAEPTAGKRRSALISFNFFDAWHRAAPPPGGCGKLAICAPNVFRFAWQANRPIMGGLNSSPAFA